MRKTAHTFAALLTALALAAPAQAQLAKGHDKFLGNITTSNQVDPPGMQVKFADLWNQLTPENETKWSSVEGTEGRFNWDGADRCYNYCKEKGIPFKFHTLVWGSQFPEWLKGKSASATLTYITRWMDKVAARYPDLKLIDVVNEAVWPTGAEEPHAPDILKTNIREALGGTGATGYDWIIEAFRMARARWPQATLIYNDYNTFQWQKSEYIALCKALKAQNTADYTLIDAIGCQSHDLNDMDGATFKAALQDIHDQVGLPIYITEYDIAQSDDELQLRRYREQFPTMWEAPYVAGVTLWGYIYGKTWTTNGNSGLIRADGSERPALKWLRNYLTGSADPLRPAAAPYGGTPQALPGQLIVGHYDVGGEGVGYHVTQARTQGNTTFRSGEGVSLVGEDPNCGLAYTEPGQWLAYTVEVSTPGTYSVSLQAGTGSDNSAVHFELLGADGTYKTLSAKLPVANQGWSSMGEIKGELSAELPAGRQTIRLVLDGYANTGGAITFALVKSSLALPAIQAGAGDAQTTYYDLSGRRIARPGKGVCVEVRGGVARLVRLR